MRSDFLNFYTNQHVLTKHHNLPDPQVPDTWYPPTFFDILDIYPQYQMYSKNDRRYKPNADLHQESMNILGSRFLFPDLYSTFRVLSLKIVLVGLISLQNFDFIVILDSTDRLKQANPKKTEQTQLLRDCIDREVQHLGMNYWVLLNGVIRYTANHLKGNPGFGIVNGTGERLNREAMRVLEGIL